jgi:riboflavin synthase
MFSGIVETMGRVIDRQARAEAVRFRLGSPEVARGVAPGDSVSVEGVCLTVVAADKEAFEVEVIPETLRLTSLGELRSGSRVNLERALTLSSRLGGHLVSGHIDGSGIRLAGPPEGFQALVRESDEVIHWYSSPAAVQPYLVPKGSITVQGVSLTVVEVTDDAFSVALIPHTLEVTSLGSLPVGGRVNLEADMIAKYVSEQLRPHLERLHQLEANLRAGGGR